MPVPVLVMLAAPPLLLGTAERDRVDNVECAAAVGQAEIGVAEIGVVRAAAEIDGARRVIEELVGPAVRAEGRRRAAEERRALVDQDAVGQITEGLDVGEIDAAQGQVKLLLDSPKVFVPVKLSVPEPPLVMPAEPPLLLRAPPNVAVVPLATLNVPPPLARPKLLLPKLALYVLLPNVMVPVQSIEELVGPAIRAERGGRAAEEASCPGGSGCRWTYCPWPGHSRSRGSPNAASVMVLPPPPNVFVSRTT